jgi:hypothetical protein
MGRNPLLPICNEQSICSKNGIKSFNFNCLFFQRLLDGNFNSKVNFKKVLRAHFTLPKNMEEEGKISIINYYTSVTFVRHPFIRLVSAFKDKIIDNDYHQWRSIVDFEKDQVQEVSFSKFMNFIKAKLILLAKFIATIFNAVFLGQLLSSTLPNQPYPYSANKIVIF